MEKYLKAFTIGSSYPVFFIFMFIVKNIKSKKYKFDNYIFLLPVYFGLVNLVSLLWQEAFHLSYDQRYLLVGIASSMLTSFFSLYKKTYNWESINDKIKYIIMIWILHNFVIQIIMKNLNKTFIINTNL